ncbi:MAG: cupredoxin domain-containing protein [Nanoarchaeota archaeon]|nr:cupredoxin domain-containing protein [Nanoarchaeota archaeon]MBU1030130.1 cupredoxin domain-containing protein [Nanoarchaeota archaeon]MBU1850744.1 cupredoxin domain-containing protein [Nanoarchaeota archaeon]
MRKTIIAITFVLLLFLFVGCNNSIELPVDEDVVKEVTVKEFEVRIMDGRFDPNTITVNQGDVVRLNFMNTDIHHISIPECGVDETVDFGVVEFVAEKVGKHLFYCLDCDGDVYGVVNIQ